MVISCNMKLNLDYLLDVLWEHLALLRVYTKKPGIDKQHFQTSPKKCKSTDLQYHALKRNIKSVGAYVSWF